MRRVESLDAEINELMGYFDLFSIGIGPHFEVVSLSSELEIVDAVQPFVRAALLPRNAPGGIWICIHFVGVAFGVQH
jgi:hypothetical protein